MGFHVWPKENFNFLIKAGVASLVTVTTVATFGAAAVSCSIAVAELLGIGPRFPGPDDLFSVDVKEMTLIFERLFSARRRFLSKD